VDLYVDSICGDPRNNAHGPEYRALWQQWTREQQARRDALGEAGFFLPPRVIPAPSADHAHYAVVPLEDATAIIKKSRRRIAQQCPCRFRSPDCGYPKEDICLMFDFMADYFAERGFGKELTMEEALETLQRASKAGLVHLSSEHYYDNSQAGTEYICNCCPCCCAYLESYFASGRTARLISNYFAKVDASACVACGVCTKRCHFTAITLLNGHATVDVSKCVGCSLCAVTCASKAIHIERKPEDQCHSHPHVARHFVEPKE
jgi:ferredoxin